MGLTKIVLKRPVTVIMAVLCLIVFGITSITSMKQELTPDMEMPMIIISTTYIGADPQDMDELISKPIEDTVGTLNGIKSVSSISKESSSIVLLEYEYGTDMDEAYDDLKKKTDTLASTLPDDASEPMVLELNMNDSATMTLAVENNSVDNLYNYVEESVEPEFNKLSEVASVDISGGQKEYISITLNKEKLQQHNLNMNAIVESIAAADLSFPSGTTQVGNLDLSVTTSANYDTMESLKKIPINVGDGTILYLKDVADINTTLENASSIARYSGDDTISISIKKQQNSTATETSESVQRSIQSLMAENPDLHITVVNDTSESIQDSLKSVMETMVLAIILSMLIIFLFFGDLKASLIVGTSIPISIFTALILINAMGFSLNVITMGAIVMGVGMMVDNSIVVLESCFRITEQKQGLLDYAASAFEGTNLVVRSIIGSTLTTCVVFLPLALIKGMSGQLFKPLGFTIVFCMAASLISAITIVPLCYKLYRPVVKENAIMYRAIGHLQEQYHRLMRVLLPKKKTVVFCSVVLLIFSFFLASQLRMELMPADDNGEIGITIETRPGLNLESVNGILEQVEQVIAEESDLDSYMLTYGGSGISMGGSNEATLTAFLKDDRKKETEEVVKLWKKELGTLSDCSITVELNSSMSMMSASNDYEVILKGVQYDQLKQCSDQIVSLLYENETVTNVHSTLENAAPVVDIQVDAVMAKAEGLTPLQIASAVRQLIDTTEATTIDVDGEEVSVMVEYPKGDYESLEQIKGITLATAQGGFVALEDVATIAFKDSPADIQRTDKEYQVTISANYVEEKADMRQMKQTLDREVVTPNLKNGITIGANEMDQSMTEEFLSLFQAIATALFLLFAVMAAQFESPRFSVMVMTTIPFSLIGAFGLMFLLDTTISMTSLLGFLMLIGTVVNNGILYVDAVNQLRPTMDLDSALIEAGAIRLRPILMTTSTTILSMIPMIIATGGSSAMTKGLAVVNVGGLLAGTVLALIMLPAYYALICKKPKKKSLPA